MYKPENYDSAKPITNNFNKISSGPYVLGIVKATETVSKTGNTMLVLSLDIAKGKYQRYYRNLSDTFKRDCLLKHYRVLDIEKSASYLKRDIQNIENSNDNYKFDFNEQTLVGKYVGGMLAEEEYFSQGEIKTIVNLRYLCTVKEVEGGLLKVPEKKKINTTFNVNELAISEDDLPF